jgi:zinc protease
MLRIAKTYLTAILALSLTVNARSQTDKVEFTEFELDNGLKVILSRDTSIPEVAINVCYHVGSKDEVPTRTGFAHLFEHLMFEGSKNVPPGDYDRLSLLAGGENNAYTTDDKTNYYLVLPSHQIELGLWLESDRMLQFAFLEKDILNQKEVVKEEKRQQYDNRPYGTVGIELAPRLFKKSGYRWDTIGDLKDIDNATYEDIKSFFEKYYVPNNAVLSIVGDIDIEETQKLIHKYFDGIPRGNEINRPPFEEEALQRETKDTIYDNVQFPGIFIAYRVPGEDSREFFLFDILSDILADGESSRLYKELVYKKQIASDIGSYIDAKEFAGILQVYAILMPNRTVKEAQEEIDRILESIANGDISDTEIQKAKNKAEVRNIYRSQTILSKADALAHYKTFYNDANRINTILSNYETITRQELTEVAKRYLNKGNRVVLYYMPKK